MYSLLLKRLRKEVRASIVCVSDNNLQSQFQKKEIPTPSALGALLLFIYSGSPMTLAVLA